MTYAYDIGVVKRRLYSSWVEPVRLMVNSSIFLSRCIFNRELRWKTFFISVESSLKQKRHRGPWNKCIYAAYSTCGMQCVPNRFQIASFVNVRPSLSAPMHFDLHRGTSFTPRMMRAETRTRSMSLACSINYHIFDRSLKSRRKYACQIRWEW